jgi:PKD repeat protein
MRRKAPQLITLTCFLLVVILLSNACKDDSNPEPVGLKAGFSAAPFEGLSPLPVEFKDASSGSPDSWQWDFQGDGSFDAFISDPSYTYDEPGFYDVKLVVSNEEASDSLTIFGYIYLNRDDVHLNYDGVLSPSVGELAEIPLMIGHDAELAAITLILSYDKRIIDVKSIEGDMEGFVSNIDAENGSISIAWSSVNPLVVKQNDILFRLMANILTGISPVSHYLRLRAGTEFAGPSANILTDIELIVPSMDTRE